MKVEPYLFFDGRCEEAIEFYRSAVDAEVMALMRFGESPEPEACSGAGADKVMHANLRIGESVVMVSDGRCEGHPDFQGFALTIPFASEAEARRRFDALSEGGEVQMPLAKTFWSPCFGMVKDRFGVLWMIMVME